MSNANIGGRRGRCCLTAPPSGAEIKQQSSANNRQIGAIELHLSGKWPKIDETGRHCCQSSVNLNDG